MLTCGELYTVAIDFLETILIVLLSRLINFVNTISRVIEYEGVIYF